MNTLPCNDTHIGPSRTGPHTIRRTGSVIASLCLLGGLLAGCQSTHHALEDAVFADYDPQASFRYLVQESDYDAAPDEDVLALTPEIRELIDQVARSAVGPRARLIALAELFAPDRGLHLDFEPLGAYTAAETLVMRAGNCLSFAHLFIAMARELGIEARYLENLGALRWEEMGEFVLANRHVVVHGQIYNPQSALRRISFETYEIDFGIVEDTDSRFSGLLSDDRARALHFNNRGAWYLTEGDNEESIRYFNRALTIDRDVSYIWGNLGTAYARLDDHQRAEVAYRQALRVDAFDGTAMAQLSRLYRSLGENELAAVYDQRRETLARQNPYRQFYEGIAALEDGDLERAVERLDRAARLQPGELHFHLELGRALALSGDARRARRELQRAVNLAERIEDEQAIAAVLQDLQDAISDGALPARRGGFADSVMPEDML